MPERVAYHVAFLSRALSAASLFRPKIRLSNQSYIVVRSQSLGNKDVAHHETTSDKRIEEPGDPSVLATPPPGRRMVLESLRHDSICYRLTRICSIYIDTVN